MYRHSMHMPYVWTSGMLYFFLYSCTNGTAALMKAVGSLFAAATRSSIVNNGGDYSPGPGGYSVAANGTVIMPDPSVLLRVSLPQLDGTPDVMPAIVTVLPGNKICPVITVMGSGIPFQTTTGDQGMMSNTTVGLPYRDAGATANSKV